MPKFSLNIIIKFDDEGFFCPFCRDTGRRSGDYPIGEWVTSRETARQTGTLWVEQNIGIGHRISFHEEPLND